MDERPNPSTKKTTESNNKMISKENADELATAAFQAQLQAHIDGGVGLGRARRFACLDLIYAALKGGSDSLKEDKAAFETVSIIRLFDSMALGLVPNADAPDAATSA